MARIFLNVQSDEIQSVKRAGYSGEIVEHIPTHLQLHPDASNGFYIECDYSIENRVPLTLFHDIELFINRVSHVEKLSCSLAECYGRGRFFCGTGVVKISEIGVRLEVRIFSESVNGFNATVEAFLQGQLKPAGSDQTVAEKMFEQVKEIKKQLVSANDELQKKERRILFFELTMGKLLDFVNGVCPKVDLMVRNNDAPTLRGDEALFALIKAVKQTKSPWYKKLIYRV